MEAFCLFWLYFHSKYFALHLTHRVILMWRGVWPASPEYPWHPPGTGGLVAGQSWAQSEDILLSLPRVGNGTHTDFDMQNKIRGSKRS